MIRIDVVFTEEEAIGMLRSRGLEVRKVRIGDVEEPERFAVDEWQVMNPFTGRWEKAHGVFRMMAEKVVRELVEEKVARMDLYECFTV